jgi:hypothetical protein
MCMGILVSQVFEKKIHVHVVEQRPSTCQSHGFLILTCACACVRACVNVLACMYVSFFLSFFLFFLCVCVRARVIFLCVSE